LLAEPTFFNSIPNNELISPGMAEGAWLDRLEFRKMGEELKDESLFVERNA
jgi:hypothetical protein